MGNNAIFGRYWASDSIVHKLDPRTKILLTVALLVCIFVCKGFAGFGEIAGFRVLLYGLLLLCDRGGGVLQVFFQGLQAG